MNSIGIVTIDSNAIITNRLDVYDQIFAGDNNIELTDAQGYIREQAILQ